MLKTIFQPSPELVRFVESLNLPLSQPQHRHVTQVADGRRPAHRVPFAQMLGSDRLARGGGPQFGQARIGGGGIGRADGANGVRTS